jgi:hypothetical protein
MTEPSKAFTGGCLCGALLYQALGEPLYAGYCYCSDCRRASGSAFVPFIGFPSEALRFTGRTSSFTSRSARGGNAVRNSCAICASLVFGGTLGQDSQHTIYAGSLDDPSLFKPTIAIFTRDRPAWAIVPPDLKVFEGLPG